MKFEELELFQDLKELVEEDDAREIATKTIEARLKAQGGDEFATLNFEKWYNAGISRFLSRLQGRSGGEMTGIEKGVRVVGKLLLRFIGA